MLVHESAATGMQTFHQTQNPAAAAAAANCYYRQKLMNDLKTPNKKRLVLVASCIYSILCKIITSSVETGRLYDVSMLCVIDTCAYGDCMYHTNHVEYDKNGKHF